jgi:hypothetical protein
MVLGNQEALSESRDRERTSMTCVLNMQFGTMLDRRQVCKISSACCRVCPVSMERDARLLVADVRPVEMVRT